MRGGTVRDIRTGRAIGSTHDLSETFTLQVMALLDLEAEFYIVYGRCCHLEVRELVDKLKQLSSVKVIYDKRMGSDRLFIFEGDPAELGFAS